MIAYEINLNEINWYRLSINSAAIDLLEANLDKIRWGILSKNPPIYTYDHEQITAIKAQLHQELIEAMRIKKITQTFRSKL
jgi:hypothetical protein